MCGEEVGWVLSWEIWWLLKSLRRGHVTSGLGVGHLSPFQLQLSDLLEEGQGEGEGEGE